MRHPRNSFALLAALLAATLTTGTASAQDAREPQRLHPTQSNLSFGPAVASDGETTCAVWTEISSYFIWASVSDGRGLTWSTPVRLDSDVTNEGKITQTDSVAVSEPFVYVSWRDDRNHGSNDDVFFTRSTDAGATWESDRRVDDGYAAGAQAVRSVAMAVDSPYVYLAMRVDGPSGNDEIWLSASSDDGANFAPAVYVSSLPAGSADAINVAAAAQGATCHVAWADDRQGSGEEVWYQRSDDAGATWLAADLQLDSSPGGAGDAQTSTLAIAADGSNVAVSWLEERTSASNEEIRFNVSQDGGANWLAADVQVGNYDPNLHDVDFNSMALHGDSVLFAWRDDRTGLDQVYAAVTDDFGTSFTETVVNTDDDNSSPLAFAWEGLMAISYAGGSTPQDHRVVISQDGGMSFGPEVSLSGSLVGDTDQTALALNERYRNLIGVWQQDDPGTNQVYAGGFRPQQLDDPVLVAGQAANFSGSGFPPSSAGNLMVVVISDATGDAMTPDGRNLGLAPSPALSFTTTPSNLIQGAINASGSATTSSVVVPAGFAGSTFYFAGVEFAPGSGLAAITDVVEATVQ